MSETPHENLLTRAVGGLFLPDRPRLAAAASRLLNLRRPVNDHSRPRGFGPDLALFENSDPTIRCMVELKKPATPGQWTAVETVDAVPLSINALPEPPDPEGDGFTLAGTPARPQLDAYVEYEWWHQLVEYGQPVRVDTSTQYVLLTYGGVTAEQLFDHPVRTGHLWEPVDMRWFVARLYREAEERRPLSALSGTKGKNSTDEDEQLEDAMLLDIASQLDALLVQRGLRPDPVHLADVAFTEDEYDAVAALTYLTFAADSETEAATPREWVAEQYRLHGPQRPNPSLRAVAATGTDGRRAPVPTPRRP